MSVDSTLQQLIEFLNEAPTAWHAVEKIASTLRSHGFKELKESEPWKLAPGERYYVSYHGSSLAAFIVPKKNPQKAIILGSHTDSPAFKLKPNAEYEQQQMILLGAEIYGAPLLTSWLNRDLGIAGRITCVDGSGEISELLVNIDHSPVIIPQLAIHLDRNVNETGLTLNKQDHLAAVASLSKEGGPYLQQLLEPELKGRTLLSHDLFLYPLEPARFIGKKNEMIAGYRIDNLCSVHASLTALTTQKQTNDHNLTMAVFWDNEETGSETAQGAASPLLPYLIERILLSLDLGRENFLRLLSQSLCVSIDLGHAVNPNYQEKSEPRHIVRLNQGIIIKSNAQQRYSSNALSTAAIIRCCLDLKLEYQNFVTRGDIPCGSTIGPITASLTGISTVDIGIPQLSMHSCRELIASKDHLDMCRLLTHILKD